MNPADFDTLDCSACEAPVAPHAVSAGHVVSYRCRCGCSWRINAQGDQTHLRWSLRADAAWTARKLTA